MTQEFKYLFSPLKIGSVTVRNRIATIGHQTFMGTSEGMATEQLARYHAERAKGGVGLIDVELASVHPTSLLFTRSLRIWDDKFIPGLKLVADMVHEQGSKIVLQIGHTGRNTTSTLVEYAQWCSSAIPCPTIREMPKAMEIEDIKELVNAYAEAARRAKEAGFDGVTLHSTYGGYGLCQFISPSINKRTDEYGGSTENRLRIVMELIDAIREKVGNDFLVGMQLSVDEFTPTGLTVPDYQEIAKRIEATGKIDYLIAKAGTYYSFELVIPEMDKPLGVFIPLASALKQVVDKIIIVGQGRVNDPVMAEEILSNGHADMIGMTRQTICDPETANKAREGRLEDIRTCMADNLGCADLIDKSHHVSCVQNPAVGKEKELGIGTLKPAERIKKVIVIGGGPAGMKAAEISARRGHDVTLYEKRKELGGQVRIAAKASGRQELESIGRWLEIQIKKLGVKIKLGQEATAETVLKENPDAVVVAAGSSPTRTLIGLIGYGIEQILGLDQDNVLDTWQVLEESEEVGENVVVVDDGEANWKGISVAETLADKGKKVEIISPLPFIGMSLGLWGKGPMFTRFFEKGIKMGPFTILTGVSGNTVSVIRQGKPTNIEGVDTVVLAGWHKPNEDLYFALKGKVKELYRVGDCIASRTILEATREGDQVGRLL